MEVFLQQHVTLTVQKSIIFGGKKAALYHMGVIQSVFSSHTPSSTSAYLSFKSLNFLGSIETNLMS